MLAPTLTCHRGSGCAMRFGLYTEIQLHPGKTPEKMFGEVLEQIENADRLGYDVYAAIEHFFFPKFSISANPMALFAAAAQRSRRIPFPDDAARFRVLESASAGLGDRRHGHRHGGRYEFGVGRGHGFPRRRGVPLDEHARPRYEEAVDLLFAALASERFSHDGEYFHVDDSHVVPFPTPEVPGHPRWNVGPRTYELAAEHGWSVAVPPLLPYVALEKRLDLYRERCAEHGTTPDIVWIHACHLDEDRDTACARLRTGPSGSSRATARR